MEEIFDEESEVIWWRDDYDIEALHRARFMPTKLYNILKENNICDLRDLQNYTKSDILAFRNLGAYTLNELEKLCYEVGLEYIWFDDTSSFQFDPYFTKRDYTVMFESGFESLFDVMQASEAEICKSFYSQCNYLFEKIMKFKGHCNIKNNKESAIGSRSSEQKLLVYENEISKRLINSLVRKKIYYLEDIGNLCYADLIQIRGIGIIGYNEIKNVCDKRGIHIFSSDDINVPEIGVCFSEAEYKKIFDAGIRRKNEVEKYSDDDIKKKFAGRGNAALIDKFFAVKDYMSQIKGKS